jgi:hypothetical protein
MAKYENDGLLPMGADSKFTAPKTDDKDSLVAPKQKSRFTPPVAHKEGTLPMSHGTGASPATYPKDSDGLAGMTKGAAKQDAPAKDGDSLIAPDFGDDKPHKDKPHKATHQKPPSGPRL